MWQHRKEQLLSYELGVGLIELRITTDTPPSLLRIFAELLLIDLLDLVSSFV